MKITNEAGISLPLAVWLLHDTYDYVADENYISATTLMKPVRQIILGARINPEIVAVDLQGFIARTLGHSIHDSVEKAWKQGYEKSLKLLGYPDAVIERVRINPRDDDVLEDDTIIPVYIEQRLHTEFGGWKIGGKFDMVTEGIVNDFKSTSAYAWLFGIRDEDFALQGSIYRWLDARQRLQKISEDFIRINFIFTDWQKFQAKTNPAYPQKRVETKDIALMPVGETEAWIMKRLETLNKYRGAKEADIPHCTEEELWMSDPVFKYYADPAKTDGRSTKNFDNANDAASFRASKGGRGIVIPVPGTPKRCDYCDAFPICTQRTKWFP